jgi:phenylacetate-CoA ligase
MIGEALELRRMITNRGLSRAKLEEVQNRKLQAVIRHAYDNVPYYRSLFQSAGLVPDEIRTAKDLQRIPITTKENLKKAGTALIIAKEVDLADCQAVHTSGTTGKPFATHLARRDLRARKLVEFRTLLSIGFRPTDRLAVLGPAQGHAMRFHQRLGFYRSLNISSALSWDDQIDTLKRSRPTILWAYPTVLNALLCRVNYRLDSIACPRMLITSAEMCDGMLKDRIQDNFKIEMFNFYGANEVGRIAAECSAHEGLHVNEDHVILECVNSEHPAEPGLSGEAIVTTLNAAAQPFIRYRLGDVCEFKEKPCSCGSPFVLISPPRGRVDDVVRLPSGKLTSPWPFTFLLRNMNELEQYRITQESAEHLIVELAFRGDPSADTLRQLRSRFMEYLGEPVRVDIQCVDRIRHETLKSRSFVSKLAGKGGPGA